MANPNKSTTPTRRAPGRPKDPVAPKVGYDLCARFYDVWKWQEFWTRNETPAIEAVLATIPTKARVLDIGAGTGRYLELIGSLGHEGYGIDVSGEMLGVAMRRLGRETLEPLLRLGDVRKIPFMERAFDCAICCRVLSHIEELPLALKEIFRVLRRGGVAVITDVDGRHKYSAARIPTGASDVLIKVYKHTLEAVSAAAREAGFVVSKERLVFSTDLTWKPVVADFPAIDWSGKSPIAYHLVLRKPDLDGGGSSAPTPTATS